MEHYGTRLSLPLSPTLGSQAEPVIVCIRHWWLEVPLSMTRHPVWPTKVIHWCPTRLSPRTTLLFFIYLFLQECNSHFYADDMQLILSFPPSDNLALTYISDCLVNISSWMADYHLMLDPNKTELLFFKGSFSSRQSWCYTLCNISPRKPQNLNQSLVISKLVLLQLSAPTEGD